MNEIEYQKLFNLITSKIKFVNQILIDQYNYQKASELTANIDPDNVLFVGLALQMDCKLWSGDKKLMKGIQEKGFKQVVNTESMFRTYLNKEFKRTKEN